MPRERGCSWDTTSIMAGVGLATTSSSTRPRAPGAPTEGIAMCLVQRKLRSQKGDAFALSEKVFCDITIQKRAS
eukprot:1254165-Pyramimonas_sp.AAC.1